MLNNALLRNAFHFSGIIIPVIYLLFGRAFALWLSVGLLTLSAIAELLRLKRIVSIAPFAKYLKPKESRKPTGSFFYLFAATIVVVLFNRDAAIASLLIVSIADPAASFVGRQFGKTPIAGKSFEGASTFFCTSLAILLFFPFPYPVRLAGALVATLTELFTPSTLDDNLSVPVITVLSLQAASLFTP